jgi:hypothetical protein
MCFVSFFSISVFYYCLQSKLNRIIHVDDKNSTNETEMESVEYFSTKVTATTSRAEENDDGSEEPEDITESEETIIEETILPVEVSQEESLTSENHCMMSSYKISSIIFPSFISENSFQSLFGKEMIFSTKSCCVISKAAQLFNWHSQEQETGRTADDPSSFLKKEKLKIFSYQK